MALHSDPSNDTTLRNERRDFVEWHRGRPAYALWALQFDAAAVLPRMQAAQTHLADLLLDGYVRQPHITLSLCGFPAKAPADSDEFGPGVIAAQVTALQQAKVTPFGITVGGLETFTSVPYCTVQAPQEPMAMLRNALKPPGAEVPLSDYTPHVTVGLYRDAFPLAQVRRRLQSFTGNAPLPVLVTGVDLLTYATAEIGGVLTCRARYDFATQSLQWQSELFT